MTPKDKAKELLEKFLLEVRGADRYNYTLESINCFIAKQCALIAICEIFEASNEVYFDEHQIKYYQDVKSEIENL